MSGILATALLGTGLAALAAGEGGGLGLPTAGCNTFADAKGDGNVGSQEGLPGSFPNDPDLDITGVALGSNEKALTAYIRLDKLAAASQYGDGHAFSASFTANGKAVDFTTFRFAVGEINDGGESLPDPFTLRSSYVQVGGDSTDVPFTANYDTTNSMVILSADRPALEKAIGGPVGTLSKISAESGTDIADVSETADVAEGGPVTWDADSNACFGAAGAPAPAPSESPSAAPSPSPEPSAAPAPGAAPAAGSCPVTYTDPAGDSGVASTAELNPVTGDEDLDIVAVTHSVDAGVFRTTVKVAKLLADGPKFAMVDRFITGFTVAKKDVEVFGERDFSGFGSNEARIEVGGTAVSSPVKLVQDLKASTITVEIAAADFEKAIGAPLSGEPFTAMISTARAVYPSNASPGTLQPDWDTAEAAATASYKFGAGCAPATPLLSSVGVTKAQYGDVAAVAAKLVDAAGAAVAGKTVTFTLGSSKVTGTTGADGVAKGALLVKEKAGKRSLVITSDDAKTSVDFTVSVEKTALKAVGGKGGVAATLTDDDRKPVAGQVITFASGSKKVTARTDAKGVAKAAGLPPGNIKVTYAGAAGMYAAASTTTKA